ncbi:MAG: AI-2E family transporter [Methanoregula sp.]|nr:AI-2E family transporter [Methanoregula sp.]
MALPDEFRIERALLIIALVFIIVIAVKVTSYLVSLILMAIILSMLVLPAVNWLKTKGLSNFSAVLLVTIIAVLIILGGIFMTVLSLNSLVSDAPMYQQELNTRLTDISALLVSVGFSSDALNPSSFDIGDMLRYAVSGAASFAEGIMFLFFVAVTTFFILLDSPRLFTQIESTLGRDADALRKYTRMSGYVIDFIVVRTETNFIHGLLFGGFLGIMGVHGAVLWGVLTFLLGYIPYFGLIIAAVPALFFAWLQFGIPGAIAVIVAICILNLVVENPVYSFLAARKFEMPALIVILSVIFWGWLLGLVGMFFAIPFTLMLLLIFESCDELRWINTTMGVGRLFGEKGQKTADEAGPEK